MVFFRVWKGVTDVTEWLTLSWASGSTSRSQEHRHGYSPTEEEALYSRGFIQRSGVTSFFFLLNSTNSSLSDAPFLVLLLRLLLIMVGHRGSTYDYLRLLHNYTRNCADRCRFSQCSDSDTPRRCTRATQYLSNFQLARLLDGTPNLKEHPVAKTPLHIQNKRPELN